MRGGRASPSAGGNGAAAGWPTGGGYSQIGLCGVNVAAEPRGGAALLRAVSAARSAPTKSAAVAKRSRGSVASARNSTRSIAPGRCGLNVVGAGGAVCVFRITSAIGVSCGPPRAIGSRPVSN